MKEITVCETCGLIHYKDDKDHKCAEPETITLHLNPYTMRLLNRLWELTKEVNLPEYKYESKEKMIVDMLSDVSPSWLVWKRI